MSLREAFGTIPEYMYNLACASFAGGEKDSQLSYCRKLIFIIAVRCGQYYLSY